ncbi:MAG: ATP-binding cassette domain-containing protein [Bacteroidota bacterium]
MIHIKIPNFKYEETLVLKDIDLRVDTGRTYGIVGLNGAGKTTFFNLLAGFLKSEGCAFTSREQSLLKKQIAYLDTDLFFYPKLTAREFLSVFPGSNTNYNEEKLADLFRLPLDGFMEAFSTGMKKKLLLLSQVKQDKDIYILDEPFNGLDLETNKILEVIISILNQRGKTVFISSHILEPLLNVCAEIHYLKNQSIFKSYKKEEFGLIEEELFGNYTRTLQSELLKVI